MTKVRRKAGAGVDPHAARAAHAARLRRRDRRMLLRGGLALAVLLPLGYAGVRWYERRAAEQRDLTVIGNGLPTVVQVFDRGCAECKQLRDNVAAAERSFSDTVQFRIADRATADGAILASRHGADHVTLLFFAADGRLQRTEVGVKDPEAIRKLITATFR